MTTRTSFVTRACILVALLEIRARLRQFIPLVLLAVFPAWAAAAAPAKSAYPERPIRLIVGQAAGGATDIVTRAFAKRLSDELGQTIVVDNRPGAGGIIGTALVAHAQPDGYTLLVGTNGPIAISPHITPGLQYDPLKDFAPIALFAEVPFIVVVNAAVKASTLGELIALAKAQPGKLHFASSGQAGTPHLCGELLKYLGGIDIVHVPYRGGAPAQTDLLAGRVQIYCAGYASLGPHIRSGKVRALAIAASERSKSLPQVPTAAEAGLRDFEVNAWNGILAPAKTPKAIVDRLHTAIAAVMKNPEFLRELAARDVEALLSGPTEFAQYMRRETQKWGKVIKAGKISAQ